MQSITYLKTAAYQKVFGTAPGAIHLPCMRIVNELPVKLCTNKDAVSRGVMQCINDGMPAVKVCQSLAEMANDDYDQVAGLIGCITTNELLDMFKQHLVMFVKSRTNI